MTTSEKPGGIIHVLPDSLANKIAAGEVVQRPASVVKELLENAVDAGAKQIDVLVKKAGSELIQVVDDGSGMSSDDAGICFKRHATSKIASVDDLMRIMTLGFRGEALASIAAVSQVELRTRRLEDEAGICVHLDGGDPIRSEPCAASPGTSVAVRNLFYNVPARRNFLKSQATELKHIVETFQFIALSNPEVGFSLNHEHRSIAELKPERSDSSPHDVLRHRIADVLASIEQDALLAVDTATSYVSVYGFVGKPEFNRKVRGEQFLFVNGRYVRHRGLEHAVSAAYGEMLPKGSYPFFVLFLRMDPAHVDVNVHPTKAEVKFDDETGIYGFLRGSVKRVLGAADLAPEVRFGKDGRLRDRSLRPPREDSTWNERSAAWKAGGGTRDFDVRRPGPGPVEPADMLFGSLGGFPAESRDLELAPSDKPEADGSNARESVPRSRIWQLGRKYLLYQEGEELVIVDQHAAHERILYERFAHALDRGESPSQQLLFPHSIDLAAPDYALVADLLPELRALGFDLEFFGGRTVLVRGVPPDIPAGSERSSLEELTEQFRENRDTLKLQDRDNLAKSLSCRAAIKTGQQLDQQEAEGLLEDLRNCEMPHACPHGRPTSIRLSIAELDRRFGRVGHLERE